MEFRGFLEQEVIQEDKRIEIMLSLSNLHLVILNLQHSLSERRSFCDFTDTSLAVDPEYRALDSLIAQLRQHYDFFCCSPSDKEFLPF